MSDTTRQPRTPLEWAKHVRRYDLIPGFANPLAEALEQQAAQIEALRADAERLRSALEKIEAWHGAFPPTGKFHPEGGEMSFGWCFGSNGEREFMREIARAALRQEQPT